MSKKIFINIKKKALAAKIKRQYINKEVESTLDNELMSLKILASYLGHSAEGGLADYLAEKRKELFLSFVKEISNNIKNRIREWANFNADRFRKIGVIKSKEELNDLVAYLTQRMKKFIQDRELQMALDVEEILSGRSLKGAYSYRTYSSVVADEIKSALLDYFHNIDLHTLLPVVNGIVNSDTALVRLIYPYTDIFVAKQITKNVKKEIAKLKKEKDIYRLLLKNEEGKNSKAARLLKMQKELHNIRAKLVYDNIINVAIMDAIDAELFVHPIQRKAFLPFDESLNGVTDNRFDAIDESEKKMENDINEVPSYLNEDELMSRVPLADSPQKRSKLGLDLAQISMELMSRFVILYKDEMGKKIEKKDYSAYDQIFQSKEDMEKALDFKLDKQLTPALKNLIKEVNQELIKMGKPGDKEEGRKIIRKRIKEELENLGFTKEALEEMNLLPEDINQFPHKTLNQAFQLYLKLSEDKNLIIFKEKVAILANEYAKNLIKAAKESKLKDVREIFNETLDSNWKNERHIDFYNRIKRYLKDSRVQAIFTAMDMRILAES